MVQHSPSCVRNSKCLVQRRLRTVYSLVPQICQHLRDPQFDLALIVEEKAVWNTFRHVATGFQLNAKLATFWKLVEVLTT
jgi:hypothetical protein